MEAVKLPPRTLCDMNCFFAVGHEGLHQFEGGKNVAAAKKDPIKEALEHLAEAAQSLACHGAGGYTIDTSALDTVFLRCLLDLRNQLDWGDNCDFYDPDGDIYSLLTDDHG